MPEFNAYQEYLLNTVLENNLYALLVDDSGAALNSASSMSDIASAEISNTGGYSRQAVTFPSQAQLNGSGYYEREADPVIFTASGASMDSFTKIVWVVGANSTIGDSTGTPVAYDTVGLSDPLAPGQSYQNTRTFFADEFTP